MTTQDGYEKVGASATKEDVKDAIKSQSAGLYPGAFCKVVEDVAGDPDYCSVIHADGAGTKSTIAYIHYKEYGDASVFRGIAQDSAIMNLDDMACVGATNDFVFSNTIGRNAHRVNKEILTNIIEGYQDVVDNLKEHGCRIIMAGGETADVGDLVETVIVDSTVFVRLPRKDVIDASNIKPGNVIVGLASFGKAVYEKSYNSGIGSNGFSRARHLLLKHEYAEKYPETFSATIPDELVFQGKYALDDLLPNGNGMTVGEALLSPTRTYLPVVDEVLKRHRRDISGIIHCSGGGLTKSLHFGRGLHYVKSDLFEAPPIFQALLDTGNISLQEACKVFNMGIRYEIYTTAKIAQSVIAIAKEYGIDAKVIGEVLPKRTERNSLTIKARGEELTY